MTKFYPNNILRSLSSLLTSNVTQYPPILSHYFDPQTETSHDPISVNEEPPSDNPCVMTRPVLISYSTIKPSVIPFPLPLSVLTSSIWPTHNSIDKLLIFTPLNTYELPHWTNMPTDYPSKVTYLIPSRGTKICPTQKLSAKSSVL